MDSLLLDTVKILLARDLAKLRVEISSYQNEMSIWKLSGEIKNTAGNLCLHLCGNLQHYIGKQLGDTDYIRNRDAEFSTKNLSREALLKEIDNTILAVGEALNSLPASLVEQTYPEEVSVNP